MRNMTESPANKSLQRTGELRGRPVRAIDSVREPGRNDVRAKPLS